ncbi:putative reverse transcriptase zinc-binding domain-containing protein [Medicago truncatula]|uniref:Putative reverse transcriptase zinc-binding domain-containing protein n=1 Tax=Medicago truncatula TaxID=3880 RepID=A0A396JG31_MEDTR|nr:putative reverse transcriptase zinc-binding domain-containing protein [Medicago truncatula]
MLEESTNSVEQGVVFDSIWKSPAPSKVVVFSWKLLHDRIPSKVNLAYRHVLPPEASLNCDLYLRMAESTNHLFIHLSFASEVWQGLFGWQDFSFVLPPNLFIHWECWSGGESKKKIRKGYWLIWHAAVWSIWRVRNDRIFTNTICGVVEVVEAIKVLSWRWVLSRMNMSASLYYE